jgi:hypothetical protein
MQHKHTIPPSKLFNYPELKEKECAAISLFTQGVRNYIKVLVGKQDGFWVSGYQLRIEGVIYYSRSASRKYGEFKFRPDAVNEAIESMIAALSKYTLSARGKDVTNVIAYLKKKMQPSSQQLSIKFYNQ